MVRFWSRSKNTRSTWFINLIWFDLIWFDLVWFDLIWFDLSWVELSWFELIWFDLIWFDFSILLDQFFSSRGRENPWSARSYSQHVVHFSVCISKLMLFISLSARSYSQDVVRFLVCSPRTYVFLYVNVFLDIYQNGVPTKRKYLYKISVHEYAQADEPCKSILRVGNSLADQRDKSSVCLYLYLYRPPSFGDRLHREDWGLIR